MVNKNSIFIIFYVMHCINCQCCHVFTFWNEKHYLNFKDIFGVFLKLKSDGRQLQMYHE